MNAPLTQEQIDLKPSAEAALDLGFRIFPLQPHSKIPIKGSGGFKDASFNPGILDQWDKMPDANIGIATGESNLCVLDFDNGKDLPEWLDKIQTLKVKTARGIHVYFWGARPTAKMFDPQTGKLIGDLKSHGGYVLGAGSHHPDGPIYTVIDASPIAKAPVEQIATLLKAPIQASPLNGAKIPRGSHDRELTRCAGKLRHDGLEAEAMTAALIEICEKRCVDYGTDYEEMCAKIANSICKKEPGKDDTVTIGGRAAGSAPSATEPPVQAATRTIKFVNGSSIKPMRLKWLWKGRILADKMNVFSGEPDVGKGMTTIDLAMRITRHVDFPDCKNELDGPRHVLFMSSEDDMEDTIIPRLMAAGADMSKVHFAEISENTSGTAEEGIVCLDRDLPILEAKIRENPEIVLIIPDPVIAFLGDADPNKDKDVRPIYSKMKAFAKRLGVAWLFVNHWNKNQNATSINKTSGAKTMVSAPRATWMFSKSPDDSTRYLMMKGKGNLSASGPGGVKTLAYRIIGVPFDYSDGRPLGSEPKLVWDGETDDTCENVLQEANDPKRSSKAEELLTDLLKDGAMPATDIYAKGEKAKIGPDKMKRAKGTLGYVAERIGYGVSGRWYWAKSDDDIARVKARVFGVGGATVGRSGAESDVAHMGNGGIDQAQQTAVST